MPPPADEAPDRAAILRRRAAFVASALSTLAAGATSSDVAGAQPAEVPPPGSSACESNPEDPTAAAALTLQAKELTEKGQHAQAAALLEKVHRMVPAWPVARQLVEAHARSGNLEAAYRAGAQHLECHGESEEIRAQLAELELRGGRLIVVVRDARPGATIEVDGVAHDTARLAQGILLPGGKHVVVLQGDGLGDRREVELRIGETATVELAGVPAMPCLSPCLSMYEPVARARIGAGPVGPIVGVVPGSDADIVAGGGARVAVTAAIVKQLWFEGDLFGAAVANSTTGFVLVGTIAELRYEPVPVYSFGAGFSVGYLIALADDPGYLQTSPFLGPVLIPASFRVGPASIDIRVPFWFSTTEDLGVRAFRLGLVAPQAAVTFGTTVSERDGW